jgi:apolipoprotein N-acyltransferase
MDKLAQIGLLVGFTWGTAGIIGYPGVLWKPGAFLTAAALIWLIGHQAMPPLELVEGLAFLIFAALSVARERLYPTRREEKPAVPGPE